MALNGITAGDAVATAIAGLTDEQKQDVNAIWQVIMTAIYTDIQANGIVSPVGLPVPLTSPSGPVTGTGKIL